jgi:hypothetical protein
MPLATYAHAPSQTAGNEGVEVIIRRSDSLEYPNRTLIGMIRAFTGTPGTFLFNSSSCWVRSWPTRYKPDGCGGSINNQGYAGTSTINWLGGASGLCNFISWTGETVRVLNAAIGYHYNAGYGCYAFCGIDSAQQGVAAYFNGAFDYATSAFPHVFTTNGLAEGFHAAQFGMMCSGGSGFVAQIATASVLLGG